MTLYDDVPVRTQILRDMQSIPWRLKTLYIDIYQVLSVLKTDYLFAETRDITATDIQVFTYYFGAGLFHTTGAIDDIFAAIDEISAIADWDVDYADLLALTT